MYNRVVEEGPALADALAADKLQPEYTQSHNHTADTYTLPHTLSLSLSLALSLSLSFWCSVVGAATAIIT